MAMAKGPLVCRSNNAAGSHMLIVPVEHLPPYEIGINTNESNHEFLLKELKNYQIALQKYWSSQNYDCIIWEMIGKQRHMSSECIAIPKNQIDNLYTRFQELLTDKDLILLDSLPVFIVLYTKFFDGHSSINSFSYRLLL